VPECLGLVLLVWKPVQIVPSVQPERTRFDGTSEEEDCIRRRSLVNCPQQLDPYRSSQYCIDGVKTYLFWLLSLCPERTLCKQERPRRRIDLVREISLRWVKLRTCGEM